MNGHDPKPRNSQESQLYQKAYESGFNFVNGMGFGSVDPQETQRRSIMVTSGHLAVCLLFFVVLRGYAAQPILRMISRYFRVVYPQNAQMFSQFAAMISDSVCLMLPFLLYLALDRIPNRVVFPHRRLSGIKTVCAASMSVTVFIIVSLCSGVLSLLFSLFHIVPILSASALPTNPGAAAVYVLHNTFILALFEEFVFHGAIMQSLRRYSDSFALLISSLLFALIPLNPAHVFSSFTLSLCIGFFVLYSGSLWTGIICHTAVNALSLFGGVLQTRFDSEMSTLVMCGLCCILIVSGIVSMMRLCKNDDSLFCFQNSGRDLKNSQRVQAFLLTPEMIVALVVLLSLSIRYWQVIG